LRHSLREFDVECRAHEATQEFLGDF